MLGCVISFAILAAQMWKHAFMTVTCVARRCWVQGCGVWMLTFTVRSFGSALMFSCFWGPKGQDGCNLLLVLPHLCRPLETRS